MRIVKALYRMPNEHVIAHLEGSHLPLPSAHDVAALTKVPHLSAPLRAMWAAYHWRLHTRPDGAHNVADHIHRDMV